MSSIPLSMEPRSAGQCSSAMQSPLCFIPCESAGSRLNRVQYAPVTAEAMGATMRGVCASAISKPAWWLGVLPTILLACATQASGQSAISEWQGVVRNGNGTPVSGAIVRLDGGSKAEAKSGIDGRFKLPPLPVGKYHLTIETEQHKVDYAAPMELSAVSPAVTITALRGLSNHASDS